MQVHSLSRQHSASHPKIQPQECCTHRDPFLEEAPRSTVPILAAPEPSGAQATLATLWIHGSIHLFFYCPTHKNSNAYAGRPIRNDVEKQFQMIIIETRMFKINTCHLTTSCIANARAVAQDDQPFGTNTQQSSAIQNRRYPEALGTCLGIQA